MVLPNLCLALLALSVAVAVKMARGDPTRAPQGGRRPRNLGRPPKWPTIHSNKNFPPPYPCFQRDLWEHKLAKLMDTIEKRLDLVFVRSYLCGLIARASERASA